MRASYSRKSTQAKATKSLDLLQDWKATPSYGAAAIDGRESLYTNSGHASTQDIVKRQIKIASTATHALPFTKRPGPSHAKKTAADHVKRPRNAYILFRSHTVAQNLIPKEVERDHRNISRIVSHMWKSLDNDERSKWTKLALKEKEEHKKLYPDYKYQPTLRRTDVARRNVKKLEHGDEACQEIADVILKATGREGLVVRPQPQKRSRKRAHKADHGSVRKTSRKDSTAVNKDQDSLDAVFLSASCISPPSPHRDSDRKLQTSGAHLRDNVQQVHYAIELDLSHTRGRACSAPPTPFSSHFPLCEEPADAPVKNFNSRDENRVPSTSGQDTLNETAAGNTTKSVKRLKVRPAPIFNTWQYGFCDDQALPTPTTLAKWLDDATPAVPNVLRPVSALRTFFNPWAYEASDTPMLLSPRRASALHMRRTSSVALLQSYSHRRSLLSGSTTQPSEVNTVPSLTGTDLFEEAARAAAANLEAELDAFPSFSSAQRRDSLRVDSGDNGCTFSYESGMFYDTAHERSWSPRHSFCASTLAAAARDWTSRSMDRGNSRTRQEPEQHTAEHQDSNELAIGLMWEHCHESVPEQTRSVDVLRDSVEQAVADVLGKDDGQTGDPDRIAALTRQILASLTNRLAHAHRQSDDHDPVHQHTEMDETIANAAYNDALHINALPYSNSRSFLYHVDPKDSVHHFASPLQLALSN